jgi:hypothetical protein
MKGWFIMEYDKTEVERYLKDVDFKADVVKNLTAEMELQFKCPACQKEPTPNCPNCLTNELEALVEKALEMEDNQITGCLLAMKSTLITPPTGDVVVGTRIKRVKGKRIVVKDIKPAEKLFNQLWRNSSQIYKGNVTWGMWRSIVEVEALNREIADIDINKVLSVIAARVKNEHPEAAMEDAEPEPEIILVNDEAEVSEPFKIDKPKSGFTATTAPTAVRKKVVSLRKTGMPFYQIEKELGLREVRGMTAHRIYSREVGKKAG